MKVIYEPKGRAKEYAELAVNLYRGCSHGCVYCYAPNVLHMTRFDFYNYVNPREGIISKIVDDLVDMTNNNDEREVLFCFTCDPYQKSEFTYNLTRQAIEAFIQFGRRFSILTKGGKRSEKDFDLLKIAKNKCKYGTSLIFAKDEDSLKYEPGAAPTSERINSLRIAHSLGIKTWVSIEPSWSFEDTRNIIFRTYGLVDEYRIGKLNYHPHAKEINWKEYKEKVIKECEFYKINYKLKNDLAVL